MKKQRKIINELIKILAVTLLMVSMETIVYSSVSKKQETMTNNIVERNEMASCMHIVLQRMEKNVTDVLNQNSDNFEIYDHNFIKLQKYIDSLLVQSENRPVSHELLTRLQNQKNYLESIKSQNKLTEICPYIQQMKNTVEILVVEDLQITKDEYDLMICHFNRLKSFLLFIMGITIFSGILFIVKIFNRLRKQISQIQQDAETLISSNWKQEITPSYYTELNTLADTLNMMRDQINKQLEEIDKKNQLEISLRQQKLENEQKDKLLITAQLNNLKTQINPHFMFNALNIIGKSIEGDPENALELIEAFSAILRYSLNSDQKAVSVQQDLKIVEDFLRVQKSRFTRNLNYSIHLDPQIREQGIVPMLIQPLVENSIKHGRNCGHPITVTVRAEQIKDLIHIQVKDDGTGFDTKTTISKKESTGVGLNNVKKRIEMIYKNKGKMTIQSYINKGTVIDFYLPSLKAGEAYARTDC